MQQKMKIDIAKDFSREPIGRFRSDSAVSGEVFRETVLAPALKKASSVEIVLDGTEGYGSSFLEEAFGGLIRHHEVSASEFLNQVRFVSNEDPTLIDEIVGYVQDADEAKAR